MNISLALHIDSVRHGDRVPEFLPARLSGGAAGNCGHRYIGKVYCFKLLLVRVDYIGEPSLLARRPREAVTGLSSHSMVQSVVAYTL